MIKKRVLILIWLALCVFFIIFKGVYKGWQEERCDFSNYYSSAALLAEGESISDFYNNEWFEKKAIQIGVKEGAKFSPFPPATAFLYIPLTIFSPIKAKRIWVICNVLLIGLLTFRMRKISSLNYFEIALILSLFTIPMASNIRLGQSYLLFSVIIIEFLLAIKKEKYRFGGGMLGIAASLKYLPLIYFFYNYPKSNKKLIVSIVISILLVSLLPLFWGETEAYFVFIQEFWNHSNGNISGQGQFSYTFQSIDAILANIFIYDQQFNPKALFNLPTLKGILKLLFVMIVFVTTMRTTKSQRKESNDLTKGLYIIAGLLVIPASASYHLLLLIPATLLIIGFLKNKKHLKREIILVYIFVFMSCNVLPHHIPTIEVSHTLNTIIHFPRLYGLMATFVLLLYIQKKRLIKNG